MIEPHWHKWLSGDEWAKMGPFSDEQACPYCRVERAEASAKAWEEDALLRAKNEASRRRRAFWRERRVKELEGAARECLSLIDKDASTHARPTTRAVFAVQGILRRVLSGEG
jgi:hypothetical protein